MKVTFKTVITKASLIDRTTNGVVITADIIGRFTVSNAKKFLYDKLCKDPDGGQVLDISNYLVDIQTITRKYEGDTNTILPYCNLIQETII